IDQVTQHNTLSASETANAAMSLLRQAEALRTMMERFRLRNGNSRELLMRRKAAERVRERAAQVEAENRLPGDWQRAALTGGYEDDGFFSHVNRE
ncbi:MAG: hypothetical protein LIQ31_08395, partial [Planctomycetes bacterium]|nr:hypothetical protein [Planctomycetota bacterium]